VKYYESGQPVQKRQKSWEDVETRIEEVVAAIRKSDPERLELTGRDRRLYLAAAEALKPVGRDVDHAARQYAEAAKLLEPHKLEVAQAAQVISEALTRLGKVPLSTALDFYERHGTTMKEVKSVAETVKELLNSLRNDGCGAYHIRDLEIRLGRFEKSFSGPIHEISERQITDWLQGLKKVVWKEDGEKHQRVYGDKNPPLSRRTRNNYRDAIAELFEFARRRGYVPKNLATEASETSRVKVVPGKNHIISPKEARMGLDELSPHLVPYTVLKLFSGLRTEEAFGMNWDEFRFESKAVIIEAKLAKLRQRRVPPILPNLARWLKPFKGLKGPIVIGYSSPQAVHKAVARDLQKAGVKLCRNTFRNCYISYRYAQPMDPAIVAAETGTSHRMVETNYKALATNDESKSWFSINPSKSQLVKLKEYADSLKS
jgi:integrase